MRNVYMTQEMLQKEIEHAPHMALVLLPTEADPGEIWLELVGGEIVNVSTTPINSRGSYEDCEP